jgi:hypothetical protein
VLFGCVVCSNEVWASLIGCGRYILLMLSAGVVGVNIPYLLLSPSVVSVPSHWRGHWPS